MSSDPVTKSELDENILETLNREGVAPLAEFARIAKGQQTCLLCHGHGKVTELVYHLHSSKAIAFGMAQKLSEEDIAPCPVCYGRGYAYSEPDRADRALAVLLNNMPAAAPSTGPVVHRFHKSKTLEDAWKLDKRMSEALKEDGESIEGEYLIDLSDEEQILIEADNKLEQDNEEIFWERPDIGIDEPTDRSA